MFEPRPLPFAATDLPRTFDDQTIARARDYVSDGRVERIRIELEGARIVASVRGGRPRAYDVTALVTRRRDRVALAGSCSCPVGTDCKHVAAALLAALAGDRGLERSPEEGLDATDHWLYRLSATVAAAGARAGLESQVAYVFARPADAASQRSLTIEAFVVEVPGRSPRATTLALVASGAIEGALADDVAISRLVAAAAAPKGDVAGIASEAIGRIVATGRARLDAVDGRLLRKGPLRQGTIRWVLGARGEQTPAIDVPDAELLVVRPVVWYVDRATGEAGPVGANIAPEVLGSLLGLGAVPLEGAARVGAAFASLGLPAPAVVRETRATVAPTPVLTLRTRSNTALALVAFDQGSAADSGTDEASVSFDYAGTAVEPGDPNDDVRTHEAGAMTIVPRDREAERRALRRLGDFGLVPLASRRAPAAARFALPPLGDPRAFVFLHRYLPKLRAEGWRVEAEPTFRRRVVDVAAEDAWRTVVEDRADGWFDLAIDLVLDGRRVPLLPILARIVRGDEPALQAELVHAIPGDAIYVEVPGEPTAVAFPAERLRAILETLVELREPESGGPERLAVPRERLGLVAELARDGGPAPSLAARARSTVEALARIEAAVALDAPASFRATLRAYQREGLGRFEAWRELGTGGVLADDMGLGKTLQTLAHVARERDAGRLDGPVLVVVPTSLIATWSDEAARFAPDLRVMALHGAKRAERFTEIDAHDLIITTYALLARDVRLLDRTWALAVFDEAQALKNSAAAVSKAARVVRAARRICLTGTPIENDLGELWSIVDIAVPGLLGERKRFGTLFRVPIEKRGDAGRRAALVARIRPYVLRRTKERVAADLPAKTEIVRRVELDGAQRDLYETVRLEMQARVRDGIAREGLGRSGIVVLDALLKLRQACCDPRLLPPGLAGDAPSAKLVELGAMVEQLVAEGHRVLVFSQFTSMLALIAADLATRDIATLVLTGETQNRADVVARFQAGAAPVFLASLRAGGVGLTLTAADTVIHYDPWWNPAVERQATDRVHRIGQTKPVFAYKLVAAGTVEEKILELQARKADLAGALLDGGASAESLGRVLDAETVDRLFAR